LFSLAPLGSRIEAHNAKFAALSNGIDAVSQRSFSHRHNSDDSWDSICMQCFLTVITTKREADLAEPEMKHDCGALFTAKRKVSAYLRDSLASRAQSRCYGRYAT
jgi:hypothetical protein